MRQLSRNVGLLVMLGGLLAGCADPVAPAAAGKPAATPTTHLTITVAATEKAAPQSWTLSCEPTGGSLPKAADACAFVAKTPAEALAPVPGHMACTMIFGGPQVATVKGTWRGKAVDARLNRTNGCEVDRWNKLKPLVGDPA